MNSSPFLHEDDCLHLLKHFTDFLFVVKEIPEDKQDDTVVLEDRLQLAVQVGSIF